MEIGSELVVDYSCMLMTPLLEGGGGLWFAFGQPDALPELLKKA